MNKRIMIIISILFTLSISIIVSFKLSQSTISEQQEILENAQLSLIDGDMEIIISLDDLISIGDESFEAVLDTSLSEARVHTYNGVELESILVHYGFDIKNKDTIILSGADGYSVAYSAEEVLLENNVFIAFMEDGKYISFQSIITSDMFSNRRCKWLTKVEVK